jgi:hypothetical protein
MDWSGAGAGSRRFRVAASDASHLLVFVGLVGSCSVVLFRCLLVLAVDFGEEDFRAYERCSLTPRWSQRRLPLEFMDGLSYTTIIKLAEPLARRRGSALDR